MNGAAALELCVPAPGEPWTPDQVEAVNRCLERLPAEERVRWALDYLPPRAVLSSSFGAQAAVMLHLVSRVVPTIPVIFIDTGYLFPQTYEFADRLGERLGLDLRVYRPRLSAAWQEARYGRLWEAGREGIRRYNRMNKVEPMERALEQLGAGTWFTGLRRSQSDSRREIGILGLHGERVKVHPIADWGNRDVHRYLEKHALPYHPLWNEGYVSIGDAHTSRPLSGDMHEQDTRFFGLVRECGLHEPGAYPKITG